MEVNEEVATFLFILNWKPGAENIEKEDSLLFGFYLHRWFRYGDLSIYGGKLSCTGVMNIWDEISIVYLTKETDFSK